MLETIVSTVAAALNAAGIMATAAYPVPEPDESAPLVSVCLRSARMTSSGLGNYIGVCSENGVLTEMYGEKAFLTLGLDIYCPVGGAESCAALCGGVRSALYGVDGLSVTEFSFGEARFDADSRMLLSRCTAKAQAFLVRRRLGRTLSDYGVGEGGA